MEETKVMKFVLEMVQMSLLDQCYVVRPEARPREFTVVARLTVLSRQPLGNQYFATFVRKRVVTGLSHCCQTRNHVIYPWAE